MFEMVLVPTDFSAYSQKVFECIRAIPSLKKVVLLHVIGPSHLVEREADKVYGRKAVDRISHLDYHYYTPSQARIEETKAKLAERKEFLMKSGLSVETRYEIVKNGDISGVIQDVADEVHTDLIVLGARGKGLVEGLLLGDVAKNVLRYGTTNLLLLRYAILEGRKGPTMDMLCSQPFSRILCPTDFSEPAAETVEFIKKIDGAKEVILQHVIFGGETWTEIEAGRLAATEKLNAIGREIEQAGLKVKVCSNVGSPVEEICNLAAKEDASLIAMSSQGSHEKGRLNQLTMGSTTYDVVRTTDRPVFVVRAVQKTET